MGNAIEQCLTQSLGFVGELDLRSEMLAGLELRGQAADGDRDDEVGREGQRIFELRDVQSKERRNKQKIPGKRAQGRHQQNRSAIQNHPGKQHAEKKNERNRPVAGQRRQEPAGDGQRGHTDYGQAYSRGNEGGRQDRVRTVRCPALEVSMPAARYPANWTLPARGKSSASHCMGNPALPNFITVLIIPG